MARAGLGLNWECLFANDIDRRKAETYRANWPSDELRVGDIKLVSTGDLPGHADLAWASFPCQDLSLAGSKRGLGGERSGTFWNFWRLLQQLESENRNPALVVLENVYGAITSNGGADFVQIVQAMTSLGYNLGAAIIDAELFVPQSRPRLFVVAVRDDIAIPEKLVASGPVDAWVPPALRKVFHLLSEPARKRWIWWNLAFPPQRTLNLSDVIEEYPDGVAWHSPEQTARLLAMMSAGNLSKVTAAQRLGRRVIGCVYRRTRPDADGVKHQRAEVRFDEIAGCLRTPGGGSSRQTILVVQKERIASRLLAPREAARLMGLSENFVLPVNYNEAYKLAGDGVVVPVVSHIRHYLLDPILKWQETMREHAA